MKFTKYGHACQLIEEGGAKILIDPGAFSAGFEEVTGIDAVLVTHQHADHLVAENLAKVAANNPDVKIYADEGSAGLLADKQGLSVETVHDGDKLMVKGVEVEVIGKDHAVIHSSMGVIPNVGYMIAGSFFYPGDNFTLPGREVDVLGLPSGAPWLKVSESADYVLAVKPKIAIPVHDAVLAMPTMNSDILTKVAAPAGIEIRVVENGTSTEV